MPDGLLTRLINVLGPHLEDGDLELSDPEFAYQLAKRVRENWSKQQSIIDPNE